MPFCDLQIPLRESKKGQKLIIVLYYLIYSSFTNIKWSKTSA